MMDKSYTSTFRIAGIFLSLHTSYPLEITSPFEPFLTDNSKNDILVEFQEVDEMDFPESNEQFSNLIFKVYEDTDGYCRVYHDHKDNDRPYAIGRIENDEYEEIQYLSNSREFFNESSNAFSHIAFEEVLLRRNAMILHASYISTPYGGILFSGPSGIGKSTQADLWVEHEDTRLINGDRTIIRQSDAVWQAYGSPYAGSSRCFVDQSDPIRAIVILEQSNKCSIQKLSPAIAFMKVYAGMTVNTWNKEYVQKITNLLGQMILEVPVYLLKCTPTKESVDLLKEQLEKEDGYES